MTRGALEQYLLSRQLPTSGTIQQLRERALPRLEEGTPEPVQQNNINQNTERNGGSPDQKISSQHFLLICVNSPNWMVSTSYRTKAWWSLTLMIGQMMNCGKPSGLI